MFAAETDHGMPARSGEDNNWWSQASAARSKRRLSFGRSTVGGSRSAHVDDSDAMLAADNLLRPQKGARRTHSPFSFAHEAFAPLTHSQPPTPVLCPPVQKMSSVESCKVSSPIFGVAAMYSVAPPAAAPAPPVKRDKGFQWRAARAISNAVYEGAVGATPGAENRRSPNASAAQNALAPGPSAEYDLGASLCAAGKATPLCIARLFGCSGASNSVDARAPFASPLSIQSASTPGASEAPAGASPGDDAMCMSLDRGRAEQGAAANCESLVNALTPPGSLVGVAIGSQSMASIFPLQPASGGADAPPCASAEAAPTAAPTLSLAGFSTAATPAGSFGAPQPLAAHATPCVAPLSSAAFGSPALEGEEAPVFESGPTCAHPPHSCDHAFGSLGAQLGEGFASGRATSADSSRSSFQMGCHMRLPLAAGYLAAVCAPGMRNTGCDASKENELSYRDAGRGDGGDDSPPPIALQRHTALDLGVAGLRSPGSESDDDNRSGTMDCALDGLMEHLSMRSPDETHVRPIWQAFSNIPANAYCRGLESSGCESGAPSSGGWPYLDNCVTPLAGPATLVLKAARHAKRCEQAAGPSRFVLESPATGRPGAATKAQQTPKKSFSFGSNSRIDAWRSMRYETPAALLSHGGGGGGKSADACKVLFDSSAPLPCVSFLDSIDRKWAPAAAVEASSGQVPVKLHLLFEDMPAENLELDD